MPKASFQSFINLSIPESVSGCLIICIIILYGTVAMSAPQRAEFTTSSGLLILAAIISVVIPCKLNISDIVDISASPSDEISLSLPTNGLTYVAPARAASRACEALKTSVTLVFIFFEESTLTALSPSAVIGIFITMFSLSEESFSASAHFEEVFPVCQEVALLGHGQWGNGTDLVGKAGFTQCPFRDSA